MNLQRKEPSWDFRSGSYRLQPAFDRIVESEPTAKGVVMEGSDQVIGAVFVLVITGS
jgi:hypothetical protein